MSSRLEINHGIKVSKTAIDNRFNDHCQTFIGAVLGEILRERYHEWSQSYGPEVFASFNRVRIKDSTKFKIPDFLKDDYPGVGGCAGPAGIGIQFEYDIKSGDILSMKITNGSANDHETMDAACSEIMAGDLIIRDLGYFSREVFRTFSENNAFFLSRLDSQSIVVVDKGRKRLCFKELYRQMKSRGIEQQEIDVLIGSNNQLKVRLIAQIVPNQIYEKRVRECEKRNKVNNRIKHRKSDSKAPLQMKEETRARYHFTLLITNIPRKDLPPAKAFALYRIRWQVELIFKSWKGVYNVDKIGRMKKQRFICILLAKLLLIAIHLQLIFRIQAAITNSVTGRDRKKMKFLILSVNKVFKTLHGLFDSFMQMIRSRKSVSAYTAMVCQILSRNHALEKRKNKLSSPEILELFICITNK